MPSKNDPVPQGRLRRTMPLAGFTARAAGGRIVAGLRERTGNAEAVNLFHQRTAERYADLLGHSKGVLMKAGQFFSMVDVAAMGGGELFPIRTRWPGCVPMLRRWIRNWHKKCCAMILADPSRRCSPTSATSPWRPPQSDRFIGPFCEMGGKSR
jgi:hypothetical protein